VFDSLTAPFTSMFHLIVNVCIFFAVVIVLAIVGVLVALPLAAKLFAVHLGKTIVIEGSKAINEVLAEQRKTLTERNYYV